MNGSKLQGVYRVIPKLLKLLMNMVLMLVSGSLSEPSKYSLNRECLVEVGVD